jgi:hypothetical protein
MSEPIGNSEQSNVGWYCYEHPNYELTDEKIMQISHETLQQSGFTKDTNFMIVFARAIIKASRGEK